MFKKIGLVCLSVAVLFSGCARVQIKQQPPVTSGLGLSSYPIPLYASALKGQKICLDPGHGGDAEVKNYKRGPTGVREAEVNMRVATYLREFLEQAGAQVYMTRNADYFVGLAERSYYANTCGVEYFVSMHHNALSNASVNFTSTWYHADPDYELLNIDLARYLQDGIANALNLPQVTIRPLRTDYQIYPGAGFGVLRNTKIPAALVDASFHSNPEEEQRLADPEYNKREAYGYFIGLAKFFFSGIPKATVISPSAITNERQPEIKVQINDGLGGKDIIQSSIFFKLDTTRIIPSYDAKSAMASGRPPFPLANNYHTLQPEFMNIHKTNVYPNKYMFQVAPPVKELFVKVEPWLIPADGESISAILVTAKDENGDPVADGTAIELGADNGTLVYTTVSTLNGLALGYIQSTTTTANVIIIAKSQELTAVSSLQFDSTKWGLITGLVTDSRRGNPIEGAKIEVTSLVDHPMTTTYRDGRYILDDINAGEQSVLISADGYQPIKLWITIEPNKTNLINFTLNRER
ncbi:MAG: N-acetylmuramoyl-L-alanine amidase [bacterium]|nr:N-acetylmuramoyl-L-alanine amidase [bacterium]